MFASSECVDVVVGIGVALVEIEGDCTGRNIEFEFPISAIVILPSVVLQR
jgi:hypothetical protein